MGGCDFITIETGESAVRALWNAVEQAEYDHGHSGYTGTIAEKGEFVMIDEEEHEEEEARAKAEKMIHEGDERIDDKWGPAGCFKLKDGRYMFFGWASS